MSNTATWLQPRLLTISEAMAEAKVSRRTIYNWMKDGRLDVRWTAGGGVRIDASSLWRDRKEDRT